MGTPNIWKNTISWGKAYVSRPNFAYCQCARNIVYDYIHLYIMFICMYNYLKYNVLMYEILSSSRILQLLFYVSGVWLFPFKFRSMERKIYLHDIYIL